MRKISKTELEKIYLENSNDEACKILGISKPTLVSYIKKAGIKTKGKGNRNSRSILKIED